MHSAWTRSLGAWVAQEGTAFRVWTPSSRDVQVIVDRNEEPTAYPLARAEDGTFSAMLADVRPGDRYRYRLDNDRLLPDPASRFQPEGVHGPSQVIDPTAFRWTDGGWTGIELEHLVLYELHVGAFSSEGTFAGVTNRLEELAALGVTAIELMPIADFPGNRNWGYDGVALFAPARCYGTPDDLRALVDAAHRIGLGVFLDVVYNHLGPDGAYLSAFSPQYFTDRHQTPWGAGLNLDGDDSAMVREFFIENALYWVHEYHIDGVRLDATHAIVDDGPRHFLAELTTRVRESAPGRRVLIVAEDHRNLNWMLKPERDGGWGVDAVWADAFHHQCRALLAGDSEGYFGDFSGRTEDLATTIRRGWFYTGQFSKYLGEHRGTDPTGLSASRFVICLQNHDQVGNRALGERLHHQIEWAAYRAASVLLLMAPQTPLVFMGQEWACSSPFSYFTAHHAQLGRLITEGRRAEFRHFAAFSDPVARERIPDPQALSTFRSSQLVWSERSTEPHASILRLYQALLHIRRRDPAFRSAQTFHVTAPDDGTIMMLRTSPIGTLLVVARLQGAGTVELATAAVDEHQSDWRSSAGTWRTRLTSEDPQFSMDAAPPVLDLQSTRPTVRFQRPSAVVLAFEK